MPLASTYKIFWVRYFLWYGKLEKMKLTSSDLLLPDSFSMTWRCACKKLKAGFFSHKSREGFTLKVYTLGLGDTNETLELKEVKHLEPLSLEGVELPIPVEA